MIYVEEFLKIQREKQSKSFLWWLYSKEMEYGGHVRTLSMETRTLAY